MRPKWLRGWGVWTQPSGPTEGSDPRPWWRKIAVIFGWRKEF